MEILGTKLGWAMQKRGYSGQIPLSMLVIVDVKIPDDAFPLKAAFVVLDRDTGKLRMPTYFRSQGLEPGAIEKLDMPADVVSKTEKAARQFAQRYRDDIGRGIPA
jgi:hypothetical protein